VERLCLFEGLVGEVEERSDYCRNAVGEYSYHMWDRWTHRK
jgi:hypothetical protein